VSRIYYGAMPPVSRPRWVPLIGYVLVGVLLVLACAGVALIPDPPCPEGSVAVDGWQGAQRVHLCVPAGSPVVAP